VALVGFALAASLCFSEEASAQICNGRPAFDFAPLQFGAGTSWQGVRRSAGLSAGGGSDRLFAIGSVERYTVRRFEAGAYAVALLVGTDQPLRLDNRLHFCPLVSVGFTEWSGAARGDLAAGGSVGVLARNGATLAVVPSIGILLRSARSEGTGGPDADHPFDASGTVAVGVGFTMRDRFSLWPGATIPIRASRGDMRLQIAAVYILRR
jgi:hypothetical protein